MPSEIIGHEPRLAFNGGPLGVQILNRIVRESPAYLKSGGHLVVEVGKGQGPSMLRRLGTSTDFAEARGVADEAGEIRVLVARRR
jgi:release factor glutamine methyltransferase